MRWSAGTGLKIKHTLTVFLLVICLVGFFPERAWCGKLTVEMEYQYLSEIKRAGHIDISEPPLSETRLEPKILYTSFVPDAYKFNFYFTPSYKVVDLADVFNQRDIQSKMLVGNSKFFIEYAYSDSYLAQSDSVYSASSNFLKVNTSHQIYFAYNSVSKYSMYLAAGTHQNNQSYDRSFAKTPSAIRSEDFQNNYSAGFTFINKDDPDFTYRHRVNWSFSSPDNFLVLNTGDEEGKLAYEFTLDSRSDVFENNLILFSTADQSFRDNKMLNSAKLISLYKFYGDEDSKGDVSVQNELLYWREEYSSLKFPLGVDNLLAIGGPAEHDYIISQLGNATTYNVQLPAGDNSYVRYTYLVYLESNLQNEWSIDQIAPTTLDTHKSALQVVCSLPDYVGDWAKGAVLQYSLTAWDDLKASPVHTPAKYGRQDNTSFNYNPPRAWEWGKFSLSCKYSDVMTSKDNFAREPLQDIKDFSGSVKYEPSSDWKLSVESSRYASIEENLIAEENATKYNVSWLIRRGRFSMGLGYKLTFADEFQYDEVLNRENISDDMQMHTYSPQFGYVSKKENFKFSTEYSLSRTMRAKVGIHNVSYDTQLKVKSSYRYKQVLLGMDYD